MEICFKRKKLNFLHSNLNISFIELEGKPENKNFFFLVQLNLTFYDFQSGGNQALKSQTAIKTTLFHLLTFYF